MVSTSQLHLLLELIRLAVFGGFFLFSAVTILYGRRNETIRKVFVVALVIGLIVPTLTGTLFPPFAQWYFFTQPAPQNQTQYSVYVVDDRGVEYEYPETAASPGGIAIRGELIVTEYDADQQEETAQYLLENARDHRVSLQDGVSPLELSRYDHINELLGRGDWTPEQAREMGELEELRVYRVRISTSSKRIEITDRTRELVYRYDDGADRGGGE